MRVVHMHFQFDDGDDWVVDRNVLSDADAGIPENMPLKWHVDSREDEFKPNRFYLVSPTLRRAGEEHVITIRAVDELHAFQIWKAWKSGDYTFKNITP